MTAATARVPLHPTISDGGHPSLHIDPGITLSPMLLGLADRALSPRQQQTVGVRTLHGNDEEAGLRGPVATAEDITDSFPLAEEQRRAAAPESPGRLAGGMDHEINEPAQFILDNLAFLANIWGPTARAWSCHCRT